MIFSLVLIGCEFSGLAIRHKIKSALLQCKRASFDSLVVGGFLFFLIIQCKRSNNSRSTTVTETVRFIKDKKRDHLFNKVKVFFSME